MTISSAPVFFAGMILSLSLIMAIGPQNAHVISMGLLRQHLWLTIAVCALTDVALITAGVAGLAQIGGLPPGWLRAITGAGAVVLLLYGALALRRFLQPAPQVTAVGVTEGETEGETDDVMSAGTSRRKAIYMALALSWLNPHAWLDTAVLIGTASLAYAAPGNAVFGLGAAVGSALWFSTLGCAMWLLGRRLNSPALWRAMDGLVALMMWGTAGWLLASLF